MLPYWAGFRAIDDPLFCIEPGMLRYAPAELLSDSNVGVVHSMKACSGMTEAELRQEFRSARRA